MKRIVIDTNILVRLLVELETEQSRVAQRLLATHTLFILKTVLLETEWVLRSIAKADRPRINRLFCSMLDIATIEIEDAEAVTVAFRLHLAGMDFGDALHVCALGDGERFLTFDRDLVRRGRQHLAHAAIELAS